jgi:4-aminobutyrate aminotransferase-like enzyme/Ser/Thr protein kinase RdoA (MazF antagonist)
MTTDPLDEATPALTAEDAVTILAERYGLSGELVALHGERDLNFRVEAPQDQRYLLKIYNPAEGRDAVEMRTAALAHIARVDPTLPICKVLPTTSGADSESVRGGDGRESEVQLFTFLDGRHPSRDELGEAALYEVGGCVARLGRALRGFFHPAAGYPIQWDIRRTGGLRDRLAVLDDEMRLLTAPVIDRFDEHVAPVLPRFRAQVVHNDMSRANLLVSGSGEVRGITDFGDMTHTALVCDLAVAISDVLDGRPDSLEMAAPMIAGYDAVTPLEPAEATLLGDLVAARLATAIVVSAWRLSRHPDAPEFPDSAVDFLRLMEREGFGAVGRRFERVCGAGPVRASTQLPYRPRPTDELAKARALVLGPLAHAYDEPLHLVRGRGVHLFDVAGHRYLDAYNNVPVVGHSHPDVARAIAAQSRLLVTNTRYLHESSVELAERLLATAPGGLDRVLFVNSGSEANDLAWRIACHATGNSGAIVTRFAYHGVTTVTTDFSPEEWPIGYAPSYVRLAAPPAGGPAVPGDTVEPLDVASAVAALEASGRPPAALFVDPAFTSDGILGPAHEWMRSAAAEVRAGGGLFVADEVQVGYGRSGERLWSISAAGVEPDLMTLGKPMGNGFPVAAVLGRSAIVDPFMEETGYFSTFGGNTLACTAALAVLRVIDEEDLVVRAGAVGAHLRTLVEDVAAHHDTAGALRSWGLVMGLDVDADGQPDAARAGVVVNRLHRLGVLVGATGPAANVIKIRPPLVFAERDAEELAARLHEALSL